jgi:hypothetical protein
LRRPIHGVTLDRSKRITVFQMVTQRYRICFAACSTAAITRKVFSP